MTEYIIQPRLNTAAGAAANNRVLAMGERGYETDAERWKTGDGATNYNDLPYDDDPAKIAGSTATGRAVLTGDAAAGRTALGAASKNLHPAPRLRVHGHSIMNGSSTSVGGAVKGSTDQATLIAAQLGLPLDKQAIAGAVLYNHLSADDWATIAQYERRPPGFAALGGMYAVQYGINDAAYLGGELVELLPYRHALRATIARLRCASVFEDDDASVVLGGSSSWVRGTSTAANSGIGFSYNTTSGATITINTPKSFPGGNLDLFFVAWDDAGGGVVTGPTALGSPTITTTEFAGSGSRRTGVMRIGSVPAGENSWVFTTSSVTGSAGIIFDAWGWEPPEDACAMVAVLGMPKPLDYTSQSGAPAGPVGDDGVDNLNTIHAEVVAEFGQRVGYINLSYLDKNANGTFWEAGNIHYSATGHAYAAAQTVAFFESFDVDFLRVDLNKTSGEVVEAGGTSWVWNTYTPTLTGITLGSGSLFAAYRDDGDGTVDFYARIIMAADSAVTGTVTVSLPANMATAYSGIGLNVLFTDAGTAHYRGMALALALDKVTVCATGTSGVRVNLSATAPFTWAVGDIIDVGGSYRRS